MDEENAVPGVVTPLFMKHMDLGVSNTTQISGYALSKEIEHVISRDEIDGIQRIGGLWRLYVKTEEAKIKLLAEGLTYNDLSVPLSNENPFLRNNYRKVHEKRGTKVLIQNLLLSVPGSEIEKMLEQLKTKAISGINYEYERDENRELTSIKNGTRSVLIEHDHLALNPLPRFALCGNWRCRIFYRDQPNVEKVCYHCYEKGHVAHQCKNDRVCRICRKSGHEEGSELCEFYLPNNTVGFKGEDDVLSNFYKCNFVWKGDQYACVEHAFQAQKATLNKRPELAEEIKAAEKAVQAKQIGKAVYTTKNWEENNEPIMFEMLEEKMKQNKVVCETLLKSNNKIIAECVPNQSHWSCGLPKHVAIRTDPDMWPGKMCLDECG